MDDLSHQKKMDAIKKQSLQPKKGCGCGGRRKIANAVRHTVMNPRKTRQLSNSKVYI